MYFVAWNGEIWSRPFRVCDLREHPAGGGLSDADGCSVTWNADGYRGENWIKLTEWTEEKAAEIMRTTKARMKV